MKISYFSILLIFLTSTNTFAKCVCERYNDPNTPVNVAIIDLIRGNNTTAINLLTESKKPNISNACGAGILLISSINNNEEVTSLFLQAGADPNMANLKGLTPVHNAAKWSSNETLSILLKAGGNPNPSLHGCLKEKIYNTPLLIAAANKNINGIKLLLKYNADFNHENKNGYNVFEVLLIGEIPLNSIIEAIDEIPSEERKKNALSLLLFNTATTMKNDYLIKLLSLGVDPNFIYKDDVKFNTPLLVAAISNNIEAAKALISHGADINYKNSKGYSLEIIVSEGHSQELSHIFK
ncbi:ankyrin repeat domain-containing protein [Marinobacterium stanieri]|nr:ankyrin repeat domain-containing protein [Marinobacterium stanieri]